MVIPGDVVEEGDVNTDDSRTPSPAEYMLKPLAAPLLRRTPPAPEDYMFRSLAVPGPSAGKARKKRKTKEPFYKGYGVVYLPGGIKGLTDKLHLLLAEFLASNTTFRNELVYLLDALLRLKQLTRREYTEINNRLASA